MIGKTVSLYEIVEKLGERGMGGVYDGADRCAYTGRGVNWLTLR